MDSLIDNISRKNILERRIPYQSLHSYKNLIKPLNTVPRKFRRIMNKFSAGVFTPQAERHDKAFFLPLHSLKKVHITRSRIAEHMVYDTNLNPIFIANHIKSGYRDYSDNPSLPAYPDFSLDDFQVINGPCYYMGFLIPHYGHFILETLTRFWWALENDIDENTKFIFYLHGHPDDGDPTDEEMQNKIFDGYWSDYLSALGIHEDNFIAISGPTLVENVLIPQCAVSLSDDWAPDCFVAREAATVWHYLNNNMAKSNGTAQSDEKIYLSRGKVENPFRARRITNEDDIEHLLRSKGYSVYYPEDFSSEFEKQHMLSNCRELVAPMGSGLLSSVFMPPKGRTISLNSDKLCRRTPSIDQQASVDLICNHTSFAHFEDDYDGEEGGDTTFNIDELEKSLNRVRKLV